MRFNDDLFIWLVEIGYMNLHENTSIWLWVDKDNLHFTSEFFSSRFHLLSLSTHRKKKKPAMRFFLFQGLCTLFFGPVPYMPWFINDLFVLLARLLVAHCSFCLSVSFIRLFFFVPFQKPSIHMIKWTIEKWEFKNMLTQCLYAISTTISPLFFVQRCSFFFFFGPAILVCMHVSLCLSLSQYVYYIHIYTRWISRDSFPSRREASIALQWYMRVSFCLHFTRITAEIQFKN